jgi:REP-associated tyrosine transposase
MMTHLINISSIKVDQLALFRRGGRRPGAGRKPAGPRRRVSHRARPAHSRHHPVHVTLRVRAELPSLRARARFAPVRAAILASARTDFHVLHYSVQGDHIHLIVEADDRAALSRGMQGLCVRAAKGLNRALGRRGAVFADHYHARALATPREVRNAIAYVLLNWRKHIGWARGIDPCSSGDSFDGWRGRTALAVGQARTWLARVGWLRHGRISIDERPASGGS